MNKKFSLIQKLCPTNTFPILLIIFITLVSFVAVSIPETVTLVVSWCKGIADSASKSNQPNLFFLIMRLFSTATAIYLITAIYWAISSIAALSTFKTEAEEISFESEKNMLDVIYRGISWHVYRTKYTIRPFFSVLAAFTLFLLLFILLFNFISTIASWSIGFTTFIVSFIFIGFFIAFIVAGTLSFWNFITTSFGIDIISGEYDLDNKTAAARSAKLTFSKPNNITFFALYISYFVIFFAQIIALIFFNNLTSNNAGMIYIFSIVIMNIIYLGILQDIKTTAYIDSLFYKYNKLTFKNKECIDIN